MTIETQITFSATEPPSGPFEVAEGADVLGCSSRSFVDGAGVEVEGGELLEITKVLTCESGPKAGTVSVLFIPGQDVNESNYQTGPWEVEEGTGDFEGLGGGGDFEVVYDSETTAAETLTGTVEFAPESAFKRGSSSESVDVPPGAFLNPKDPDDIALALLWRR